MEEDKTSLNRTDRDLLISVSTKQDLMSQDIKEIKTDLISRIIKVESRIDAIELFHASINITRFNALADWLENFKANYKFILFFGGLFLGILGGVVEKILSNLFKF